MNLTLSKLPFMLFMPSELLGKLALALYHPSSMMPVISTISITKFVIHSITPLGKDPACKGAKGFQVIPYRPGMMKLFTSINT